MVSFFKLQDAFTGSGIQLLLLCFVFKELNLSHPLLGTKFSSEGWQLRRTDKLWLIHFCLILVRFIWHLHKTPIISNMSWRRHYWVRCLTLARSSKSETVANHFKLHIVKWFYFGSHVKSFCSPCNTRYLSIPDSKAEQNIFNFKASA